jgi:FkbM family methyltransferase
MRQRMKDAVRRALSSRLKPHRILYGPLRGYRIVTSWHDSPRTILGLMEPALIAWFRDHVREGETWLDVGAHYGYTALALSTIVGPSGRVFAFEPVLTTAGALHQTRRLSGFSHLTVVPVGLGSGADGLSIEILPTVRGMANRIAGPSGTDHEAILVTGFDWLWPRVSRGDLRVHGVKIDVQGMELEVISGMTGTLAASRPKMVLEFHEGVDSGRVTALLEEAGYLMPGVALDPASAAPPAYQNAKSYAFLPRQAR